SVASTGISGRSLRGLLALSLALRLARVLRAGLAVAGLRLALGRGRAAALAAARRLVLLLAARGVEVRVPAAALQDEGSLGDQLLDLARLAHRAGLDRIVGDPLLGLELVAALLAGVFVDGHRMSSRRRVLGLEIGEGRHRQAGPEAIERARRWLHEG